MFGWIGELGYWDVVMLGIGIGKYLQFAALLNGKSL